MRWGPSSCADGADVLGHRHTLTSALSKGTEAGTDISLQVSWGPEPSTEGPWGPETGSSSRECGMGTASVY